MGGNGRFLRGAAVLTAAVFLTKLLGAVYKIPLGRALGSAGMAHFYAAYNVYNTVLLLTTSGMTVALSTLIAAARPHPGRAGRIFSTALLLMTALGLIGGGAMLLLAKPLAALLHDGGAAPAIAALAPGVAFVCLMTPLRGATQGLGDMAPTAVSQVAESAVKLLVGLGLALAAVGRGLGPEMAAAGAVAGVTAGAAAALVCLLPHRRRMGPEDDTPRRMILRQLLAVAAPITVGGVGMSLITVLDQALTMAALQRTVTAAEAAEQYGYYTYGLTLFVLPPSLLMPVTAALIPPIARYTAAGQQRQAAALCRSAVRLAGLAVFPLGLGLSALARPILALFYGEAIAGLAAPHLRILGAASVAVGLMGVCTGILQAKGRPRAPLLALALGAAAKIALNVALVPRMGVQGAAWATAGCYGLAAAVNLLTVGRAVTGLWTELLPGAAAGAVMALAAPACCRFVAAAVPERWAVVPAAAVCAAVYAATALALGAVTGEDVARLRGR
ncbi:MAG: oligosaccharide flippase family protein [Oscillospiraceae bacterium]|nr:oligosaccharide flippase family protein [Oscillospiraceae bacterium]MBR0211697.1 oligosaccharide flippase family protein [Oscillospiraceae bacterium]